LHSQPVNMNAVFVGGGGVRGRGRGRGEEGSRQYSCKHKKEHLTIKCPDPE
jgi:hypothetical protein